jgi:hypothetical protein
VGAELEVSDTPDCGGEGRLAFPTELFARSKGGNVINTDAE